MNRYQKLKLPPNRFQHFLKLAIAHKVGSVIILSIFVLTVGSIGVREKFVSSLTAAKTAVAFNGINPLPASTNFTDPNLASPSATESPSPSDDTVLGDSTTTDTTYYAPTPTPTVAPTSTPLPSTTTVTTTTTTSSYYNNGNAHCTSAPGLPNFWYSDAESSGNSITVQIKDCQKNLANANDTVKICVTSSNTSTDCNSSDTSAQVNGQSLPTTVVASNGSITFSVSSSTGGTDYFYLYDQSNGFALTDSNNHNPSITFSGSSATPTPSPSVSPSPSSSISPSPSASP